MAWAIVNGPIPFGKMILHTCDNAWCINPDHLYVGTHGDNMKDRSVRGRVATKANGKQKGGRNRMRCCSKGHDFVPETTGIDHRGRRYCKVCRRAWLASRNKT